MSVTVPFEVYSGHVEEKGNRLLRSLGMVSGWTCSRYVWVVDRKWGWYIVRHFIHTEWLNRMSGRSSCGGWWAAWDGKKLFPGRMASSPENGFNHAEHGRGAKARLYRWAMENER